MYPVPLFCADDWGMSPGVNEGILELAERGWLRSVSLLANAPYLEWNLERLLNLPQRPILSLHFNLTYGKPMSDQGREFLVGRNGFFFSFRTIFLKSLCGRLDLQAVRTECSQQLIKLRQLGIPATELDGHHHVHSLPGIFTSVAEVAYNHDVRTVRVMADRRHLGSYIGGKLLGRQKHQFAAQISFIYCAYLLSNDYKTKDALRGKISQGVPLICHPAKTADFSHLSITDSLQEERVREFKSILELSLGT